MQPHQERVVAERKELEEKIVKLEAFFDTDLFNNLDSAEKERLILQAKCMNKYSDVLKERIDNFK